MPKEKEHQDQRNWQTLPIDPEVCDKDTGMYAVSGCGCYIHIPVCFSQDHAYSNILGLNQGFFRDTGPRITSPPLPMVAARLFLTSAEDPPLPEDPRRRPLVFRWALLRSVRDRKFRGEFVECPVDHTSSSSHAVDTVRFRRPLHATCCEGAFSEKFSGRED